MMMPFQQQLSPPVSGPHAAELEAKRRRRLLGAVAILALLTGLLSVVAAGDGVLPGDLWVARSIQRSPAAIADPITGFVYWLGSLPALSGGAMLVAGAFAARRRWVAAILILSTVPVRGVNPLLKRLLDSPRPVDDLVQVTEQARGMGFPSGHSMGVALLYGLTAFLLARLVREPARRKLIWTVASVVILLTGFGRVNSGAHWPSDVLGGYLWAAVVALVLLGIARVAAPRPMAHAPAEHERDRPGAGQQRLTG